MANLTRYKQKIFANNSNQVGVFGTGVDKETSKNVETLQSEDYESGWSSAIVTEKNYPIWQERDGVDYGFSYQLAYLLQKGIPEWLSTETYYMNDYCRVGSDIYYSLQDNNTGHNPTLNDGYWALATGANKNLSNLTSVGEKHFLNKSQITNCILDIPQDINITLNSSRGLVLNAGSKVYIPNGFEQDGTTPKFDVVTIDTDIQQGNGHAEQDMYFYRNLSGSRYLVGLPVERCYSGTTAPTPPSGVSYMFWYDTGNNLVKYYDNGTWITNHEYSLPICITTGDSTTTITSIDQVFNGFGYVGLTYFSLPGIKFLSPNGRNSDGTLKNTEYTTTKVSAGTLNTGSDARNLLLVLANNFISLTGYFKSQEANPITASTLWYRPSHNRNYISESTPDFYTSTYIPIGYVDRISNRLTNFQSKLPIRLIDYSDKNIVTHWSMPSNKYMELTLGASGTQYTAPADGWFVISKFSGTNNACQVSWCTNNSLYNAISSSYCYNNSGMPLTPWIQVKKGDKYYLQYSATGDTIYFRFYYAVGSESEV